MSQKIISGESRRKSSIISLLVIALVCSFTSSGFSANPITITTTVNGVSNVALDVSFSGGNVSCFTFLPECDDLSDFTFSDATEAAAALTAIINTGNWPADYAQLGSLAGASAQVFVPYAVGPGNIFTNAFAGTNDSGVTWTVPTTGHVLARFNGLGPNIIFVSFSPSTIAIDIDIKPGSDPNSINLCSNGAVPIAILGSNSFDVNDINTDTLRFAEASVKVVGKKDPHSLCSYTDVNGDFITDLVCHFVTTDIAGIDGESTSATLNGELNDGTAIEGTDTIHIVKDTCN